MQVCHFMAYMVWMFAFFSMLIVSEPKRIVCYVDTKCATRPSRGAFHLADLDASLCTHVIFGFPRLKSERIIDLLDSWIDFMNGTDIRATKLKFPNVVFMVALGGWYNGVEVFRKSAENGNRRRILAQTAVDFVKQNNFDGLELCWLYPTKRGGFLNDRRNFVELLKEFKIKFAENNLVFTALLGGSSTTIDTGYNIKEIFAIVDFANLISYDYNGLWSEKIAPNAPLYSDDKNNVNYTVQHLIELGADREKITIGIPFYGRIFFARPRSRRPALGDLFDKDKNRLRTFMGPYTKDESGDIGYNEICLEQLKPGKWKEYWDNESQTPYLVTKDKLITYENMSSVDMKVEYALRENLGGVMVFSLDQDDIRGDCSNDSRKRNGYKKFSMLKNLNKTLKRYVEKSERNGSKSQNKNAPNCISGIKITNIVYLCSSSLIICTNKYYLQFITK